MVPLRLLTSPHFHPRQLLRAERRRITKIPRFRCATRARLKAKKLIRSKSMFDKLDSEARLLLLRFVCAFAWADLELKEAEERFVRTLVDKLDLGEEETAQVEDWLVTAPSPESVDPKLIPEEHKRVFIEAVRAVMYVDGDVDEDERAQLDALKAALGA